MFIYLAILALVVYVLFIVWPAPLCLTGGLLLIAASVFGWRVVMHTPVQAVEGTVLLIERRYGSIMVLALLFAMFAIGVALWAVYGGR